MIKIYNLKYKLLKQACSSVHLSLYSSYDHFLKTLSVINGSNKDYRKMYYVKLSKINSYFPRKNIIPPACLASQVTDILKIFLGLLGQ